MWITPYILNSARAVNGGNYASQDLNTKLRCQQAFKMLILSVQLNISRPNPLSFLKDMVAKSVQSKELLARATLDGHISKGVWVLPYGAYRPC